MAEPLPTHYESLVPFRSIFATGLPVLMYHKLGRPQLLAGNKGLFVAPGLFARQLAELKQAGVSSALPHETESEGKIAITFDDGYASAFRHACGPLREYGFRAIQFLVAGFLGKRNTWDAGDERLMDRSQVRDWLQAGHSIGAHSVTHPHLTQIPEERAREEIKAAKFRLEDGFGFPVEHFCYPYGDFNERIAALAREAGYRSASGTGFGVNTRETNLFAIQRIAAYFSLRNPRNFWLTYWR